MRVVIFLLIALTSCFAESKPYKTFKFENYLSWTGKFNQKQAEEDFRRLFPVGTDVDKIKMNVITNNNESECVNERREGEFVCDKYLRSFRGLFTKTDYVYIYIYADKNQKKILDFKINHYNNSFVI